MIKIYKSKNLGHYKNGWLDSRHHFSFGDYYDPARVRFGALRVVNDDLIKAGSGFDLHPHRDMEIITYVRTGAVRHRDSLGNEGVTNAGDVQVMSAGTGIAHAEFSDEREDTTLFQIWITPRKKNIAPRWEQAVFPKAPANDTLSLLVSGRAQDEGKGALLIHQDAAIYGGKIEDGKNLTHKVKDNAYILVSHGTVTVNGSALEKGDGAEVSGEKTLSITAQGDAEILVIEVPE